MTDLASVLAGLEASGLTRFVAETPGLYPLVSAAHILALALVVAPILLVDARLLGLARDPIFVRLAPRLVRWTLVAFGFAVLTGFLLFSVQPVKYAGNPAFLAKMAILLTAGANALLLRLVVPRALACETPGLAMRCAGAASAVLWLGAIVAGRWIAFS